MTFMLLAIVTFLILMVVEFETLEILEKVILRRQVLAMSSDSSLFILTTVDNSKNCLV
jgi:hypothetical protein